LINQRSKKKPLSLIVKRIQRRVTRAREQRLLKRVKVLLPEETTKRVEKHPQIEMFPIPKRKLRRKSKRNILMNGLSTLLKILKETIC